MIVFSFILPCKRPEFSHLVFDLLTVEDLIHRSQCCCRNTKYFKHQSSFVLPQHKRAKMCTCGCIVASEWISMLTVITGNQQFAATLMKQQTAVWCLTPGCRRILNEAFGLFLKRNKLFLKKKNKKKLCRDKITSCVSFLLPADCGSPVKPLS